MVFDSNIIIADLNHAAPGRDRSTPTTRFATLYKWRRLIENFFGKLKEFKRIAMRADKIGINFSAAIYLAAESRP